MKWYIFRDEKRDPNNIVSGSEKEQPVDIEPTLILRPTLIFYIISIYLKLPSFLYMSISIDILEKGGAI
jgi:hypothetical protein